MTCKNNLDTLSLLNGQIFIKSQSPLYIASMDSGVRSCSVSLFLQPIYEWHDLISTGVYKDCVKPQPRCIYFTKWPNIHQATVPFVYSKYGFKFKKFNYTAFSTIKL